MKAMTKAQTIRHLKSTIKSMDYYLTTFIVPFQDEVEKRQAAAIIASGLGMTSGCYQSNETSFRYLIADLEDCLRTVKKLKVR